MAKKKKGTKRKTTGRKMGKAGQTRKKMMSAGEVALGGVIGAGVSTVINNYTKTALTTAPLWTGGAIAVGVGILGLAFAPDSDFTKGIGAGLIGMGGLFVANETVISVPGISGMPTGLTNASSGPGYLRQKVGYRNPPSDRMGVLSSGNRGVVGKLVNN